MSFRPLYLLIASLGAALMATTACQKTKASVPLPATQATAPALSKTSTTHPAAAVVKPAPVVAPAAAKAPGLDRAVAELMAQVEKEYQAGQANYRAGHLEAAKQNFDNAFN